MPRFSFTPTPSGVLLAGYFLCRHQAIVDPCRLLLLDDQFQVNRIFGLKPFAFQHLIRHFNAFWRRFDPVTGAIVAASCHLYGLPSGVPSNPTTITYLLTGSLRRAQCAQRHFILGEDSLNIRCAVSRFCMTFRPLVRSKSAGWLAVTYLLWAATAKLETATLTRRRCSGNACNSITLAPSPAFSRYSRQRSYRPARYQTRYG